jgi:hypothetical protein
VTRRPIVLLVGVLLALPTVAAHAMTVLPLDLPQLTGQAERIFVGRVESVASGRDGRGLPAVWTTFAVEQPLKGWTGPAPAHLTLKQLGTSFGGSDAPVVAHGALPRYREGESVVLFVHPDSALGFTSPVGLGQGCFRIVEHDGVRMVENDVANANLASAAAAAPARGATPPAATGRSGARTPLPLATFVAHVQALVGTP